MSRITATQALSTIGLVLIIVAATVIVFRSWPSLSPLMRFLAVLIPNLILFVIGFFVRKQPMLAFIDEGTNAVGLLLLPLTFGVFYYQFGLVAEIDVYLFLLATATAIPVMIIFDFWRKQLYPVVLTLITALSALMFLGIYQEWAIRTWDWVGVGVGTLLLIFAILADRFKDPYHVKPYQIASALMFFFFMPMLWLNLTGLTFWFIETDISHVIIFSLASGLSGLIIASLYSWLFSPKTLTTFQLQRFVHFGTILTIFWPLLSLVSDQAGYVVLPLIIAVGLVVLGMFVGENMFFILGIVGVVVSLLVVMFRQLTGIQTPIFLFIIGFVAIGISIFLSRIKLNRQTFYNPALARALGIISDEESETLSDGHHVRFSIGRIILLFILAILGFSLLNALGSFYAFNRSTSKPSTTAPVTQTADKGPAISDPCDNFADTSIKKQKAGCSFKAISYTKPFNWIVYTKTEGYKVGYYLSDGTTRFVNQKHSDIIITPTDTLAEPVKFISSYYGLSDVTKDDDIQSSKGYSFNHYHGSSKSKVAGTDQASRVDLLILAKGTDSYMFSINYNSADQDKAVYTEFLGVINSVSFK